MGNTLTFPQDLFSSIFSRLSSIVRFIALYPFPILSGIVIFSGLTLLYRAMRCAGLHESIQEPFYGCFKLDKESNDGICLYTSGEFVNSKVISDFSFFNSFLQSLPNSDYWSLFSVIYDWSIPTSRSSSSSKIKMVMGVFIPRSRLNFSSVSHTDLSRMTKDELKYLANLPENFYIPHTEIAYFPPTPFAVVSQMKSTSSLSLFRLPELANYAFNYIAKLSHIHVVDCCGILVSFGSTKFPVSQVVLPFQSLNPFFSTPFFQNAFHTIDSPMIQTSKIIESIFNNTA